MERAKKFGKWCLMGLLYVVVMMLYGCGDDWTAGDPTPAPRQDEAIQIVWHDVYGMDIATAPAIRWTNVHVECNDKSQDGCTYNDAEGGVVIMRDGAFSNTLFAHELCHARMLAKTGDVDAGHTSECFNGNYWNGGPGSLTAAAILALKDAGL